MRLTVNGKNYELKTTLGTVKSIEETTSKTLPQIVAGLQYVTVSDIVQIFGCACDDKQLAVDIMADDALGHQQLFDAFNEFQYRLRYPGKTREEAEREEIKKLLAAEAQMAELRAAAGKSS